MARQASATIARRLRGLSASGWLRAAVSACAILAVALALLAHALSPASDGARALIGQRAPSFTAPAAQSGKTLAQPTRFSGSSDHPTLLVFFDTLCTHCIAGVQVVQSAVSHAPGQPAVNVIYLDAPGENAEITGQFMARLQMNPPVLLDKGAGVASRYHVSYYPTLVLVDARGVVRAVWVGAPTTRDLRVTIARLA